MGDHGAEVALMDEYAFADNGGRKPLVKPLPPHALARPRGRNGNGERTTTTTTTNINHYSSRSSATHLQLCVHLVPAHKARQLHGQRLDVVQGVVDAAWKREKAEKPDERREQIESASKRGGGGINENMQRENEWQGGHSWRHSAGVVPHGKRHHRRHHHHYCSHALCYAVGYS